MTEEPRDFETLSPLTGTCLQKLWGNLNQEVLEKCGVFLGPPYECRGKERQTLESNPVLLRLAKRGWPISEESPRSPVPLPWGVLSIISRS